MLFCLDKLKKKNNILITVILFLILLFTIEKFLVVGMVPLFVILILFVVINKNINHKDKGMISIII